MAYEDTELVDSSPNTSSDSTTSNAHLSMSRKSEIAAFASAFRTQYGENSDITSLESIEAAAKKGISADELHKFSRAIMAETTLYTVPPNKKSSF